MAHQGIEAMTAKEQEAAMAQLRKNFELLCMERRIACGLSPLVRPVGYRLG